ncbi:MAG TPA: agmatine deiminase family protein, partial [Arenimonas sp.]|nr:agmatine deiminase family protein [Arenimonas sp.]
MSESFRFPAEWESQSAVLIAWPHAGTDWAERLESVESTYVALVAAVARFERALICVADTTLRVRAERLLHDAGVDTARVRFFDVEYDDTWLRDSGPITLCGTDGFRLLDFHFTAWGGKFEAGLDDQLVGKLFAASLFVKAEHQRIDFALEGGGIETDGAGTLLSTWHCLHERHPGKSREEITRVLQHALWQQRTLWLDHGYLEGDDTD